MRLLLTGILLVLACPVWAQDSVIVIDPTAPPSDSVVRGGPPPDVVAELIAFYNDTGTTRVQGDLTLPAGSQFEGRLAVHRGSLRIAGRVVGPVAVANGTLYLLPGASVRGEILVVGGRLLRSEQVEHLGSERVYWDAAPVLRGTDGMLALRERRRSLSELATAQTTFKVGRVQTTLSLATGGTYNRIEGLPILFGPLLEVRPTANTHARLDVQGILRTAGAADDLSDFGYTARADYSVLGKTEFGFGARVYSVVEPIESHPLPGSESGWAAFLLQRDYRDYFARQGFSGIAYIKPDPAWRIELWLRRDAERSVRAADPWSLFRNSDRWRRNPLIDDGHFFTTGVSLVYDTRNDRDRPTSGWIVRAGYEHTTSDDVAPVALPPVVRPELPPGGDYGSDRVSFDARRYSRLTPSLMVNGRLLANWWIAGERLTMQRRFSLGGPDILPGFGFRAFACAPRGFTDLTFPALCDRIIATQVEVRTRLGLNLGYRLGADENHPGRFIGIEEADLVVFSDAGKGWLAGDGPGQVPVDRIPALKEWALDIGVGLDAGLIGGYLAKSLSESEPVRFVVRLQQRF